MTNQTLEETLAALCAEHDLTNFAVSCHPSSRKDYQFTATCHWDGFSRRNIECTSEHGGDIQAAVANVLAAMRADRTPDVGKIHALPAFEVSA